MKNFLLFFTIVLTPFITVFAQEGKIAEDKEAAYIRIIHLRAEKIVATLKISDPLKTTRLISIITDQYRNLNEIHTNRDELIKSSQLTGATKEDIAIQVKKLEEEANIKLANLHKAYLSQLSVKLNPNQIEQVKNGMTYGVLPITYNGYLDMLPKLNPKQKEQIMKWLIEAREYAMDAESSEKKHAWFGKYKGRINNYLSAAGYDLKKEGEDWQKRIREREVAKKNEKS